MARSALLTSSLLASPSPANSAKTFSPCALFRRKLLSGCNAVSCAWAVRAGSLEAGFGLGADSGAALMELAMASSVCKALVVASEFRAKKGWACSWALNLASRLAKGLR